MRNRRPNPRFLRCDVFVPHPEGTSFVSPLSKVQASAGGGILFPCTHAGSPPFHRGGRGGRCRWRIGIVGGRERRKGRAPRQRILRLPQRIMLLIMLLLPLLQEPGRRRPQLPCLPLPRGGGRRAPVPATSGTRRASERANQHPYLWGRDGRSKQPQLRRRRSLLCRSSLPFQSFVLSWAVPTD
jgi:hypothetical protein